MKYAMTICLLISSFAWAQNDVLTIQGFGDSAAEADQAMALNATAACDPLEAQATAPHTHHKAPGSFIYVATGTYRCMDALEQ